MFKSGRGVGKFRCPLFRSIRLNTLRAVMNPCSLFFGSRWFRHRCSMHPAADMCQAFWDSFYSSRQRTGSVVCAAVSWVVTQEVGIRRRRRPTFESMPSLMVMFSIRFSCWCAGYRDHGRRLAVREVQPDAREMQAKVRD